MKTFVCASKGVKIDHQCIVMDWKILVFFCHFKTFECFRLDKQVGVASLITISKRRFEF